MPTYEYRCTSCQDHVEAVQSFSDEALTVCPTCGGPLRKVFGSIGIVLKGSGFYKTDSRAAASGRSSESSEAKQNGKESGKDHKEPAKESTETKRETVPTGASSSGDKGSGSNGSGSNGSGSNGAKGASSGSSSRTSVGAATPGT